MRVILERPDGTRYTVAPGENHPVEHRAVAIEKGGVELSVERQAAVAMLQEIEAELGAESGTAGDWIKRLAAPIARLIGKKDCLACEVRRVMLNAAAKLKEKHGESEGKRLLKSLLIRSYREPEEKILTELKRYLSEDSPR
jgi:hypothetical protein